MRSRTRARELALQVLYQTDLLRREDAQFVEGYVHANQGEEERVGDFACRLAMGTLQNREAIDRRISELAENWSLPRMAVIDRNILRLAIYEMVHLQDVPPKVAINEAIDLAKKFSTESSGAFVNGVLDRVLATTRPV
ncbi:MAG: transcription antitermination factor NusB [Planctomycetes bacterium]|nr:transcription antitermination factor NusB [Planctomycetota bacterium]